MHRGRPGGHCLHSKQLRGKDVLVHLSIINNLMLADFQNISYKNPEPSHIEK